MVAGGTGASLPILAAALGACAGWAGGAYARREGSRLPRGVLALCVAAVWAGLAWRLGPGGRLAEAAACALGLCLAAAIDLHAYRIPNALTLGLASVGAAAHLWKGAALAPLGASLAAAAVLGALAAMAVLASRGGVGWGDAKLAAALGLVLGPRGAIIAIFAMSLASGLAAAVLLAVRARGLRDALPLAPFFLCGGLVALLQAGAAVGRG